MKIQSHKTRYLRVRSHRVSPLSHQIQHSNRFLQFIQGTSIRQRTNIGKRELVKGAILILKIKI